MGKPKFDFVVVAVHYTADGRIEWVRGFERRGPTFSDRVILGRQDLLTRLKAGDRIITGQRLPLMASTFEVGNPIRVDQIQGEEFLVVDGRGENNDSLEGVPRI